MSKKLELADWLTTSRLEDRTSGSISVEPKLNLRVETSLVSWDIMSVNSSAERKDALAGAWKLKSMEVRTADGDVTYPFGQDAKGYLTITSDGYWSVALMSANRPQFSSGDILGGTTEEKVSAAEGYISYAGRYDIRGNRVVVHAEVSFFPNWVGKDQERFFEVKGNTLELRTSPLLVLGKQQTAHLIWEHVS
jgi:hypothetical protein